MPTLSEILCIKLIPWSQQNASERFIVAGPKMRQADMPYGVRVIPHKIQSKRVIVKGRRVYSNVRNIVAEWPDADLQELGKDMLICVLDGYIDYPIGHYKLQCGTGHFLFIPRGTPTPNGMRPYVDLQKSTSCDIITFLLHPNALECWISHGHAQGRERINSWLVVHERAVFLFQMLMSEVLGGESRSLQIGEGLLNAFFILLIRELEAGHFQSKTSSIKNQPLGPTSDMPQDDFQKHIERYIQSNLRNPLTLDVVAAEMYFSPAHFTRVMRRETGKSFHEYLTDCRMQEAKKFLLNSQWTVAAIASFVGFKSSDYFRTFFKRHAGVTPSEFRASGLNTKSEQSALVLSNPTKSTF